MHDDYEALTNSNIDVVRQAIRDGNYTSHTARLASGLLQANLAIMPERYAPDFMRFCHRNPKPCPLPSIMMKSLPAPCIF